MKELTRETIRKIIELTTHESDGVVWGNDKVLGTMDELIDEVLEIIGSEEKELNKETIIDGL